MEAEFDQEHQRFRLLFCQGPEGKILALSTEKARDYIQEVEEHVHRCCSNKKLTSYEKRVACEMLVHLSLFSTGSIYRLAKEFPEPFRDIAEEMSDFPCVFPAHPDDLRKLQSLMLDIFNLGKRHELKVRGTLGRKTFSKKTWINRLLLDYIALVKGVALHEQFEDPCSEHESEIRYVGLRVPLTPTNSKRWLGVIWKLLLMDTPEPEKHPRLRQLGERPSRKQKRTRHDISDLQDYRKRNRHGWGCNIGMLPTNHAYTAKRGVSVRWSDGLDNADDHFRPREYQAPASGRKQTRRSNYMGQNSPDLLPEEQFLARQCTSC